MKILRIFLLSFLIITLTKKTYSMEYCCQCLYDTLSQCCGLIVEEAWLQIKIGTKNLFTKWQKRISIKTSKLINDSLSSPNTYGKIDETFEIGAKQILKKKLKKKQSHNNSKKKTNNIVENVIDEIVERNRSNFILTGNQKNKDIIFTFLKQIQLEIYTTMGIEQLTPKICEYVIRIIARELKNYSPDLNEVTIEQIAMHILNDIQIRKRNYKQYNRNEQKYIEQEQQDQEEQVQIVKNIIINRNEIAIEI